MTTDQKLRSKTFTGSGTPVGTVVPTKAGDIYYDTTNSVFYGSTGTTNADWIKIVLQPQLDKFENVLDITAEPTGFTDPENVVVTYDNVTRKVTLTGTVEAYYKGNLVTELVSGWESPAHADTTGLFFLQYNPTDGFTFTDSPFVYTNVLIAVIYRNAFNFGLREPHGLMQWQSHKHFHETIGTYLQSGGDLDGYTLNSTTAADRRPTISQTKIIDEDLPTVLPVINTNAYSLLNLTGAGVTNITTDSTEIIALDVNQPYWNEFTGGVWQQTLFSTNHYGKIFVMSIPVTADINSQKYRQIFIQPQTTSSSLDTIRAVTANDVNIGNIDVGLPEYCFIGEIIVQFIGGNWRLIEVNKLTGTRITQVSSPTGNYLSTVTSDTTLTGEGTSISPLGVSEANVNHNSLLNSHNLTTDIDHNALTNYDVAQHRTINDLGTSVTDLWSGSKINTELGGKQATLVSGTNIKTLGSNILIGSGDIPIITLNGVNIIGGLGDKDFVNYISAGNGITTNLVGTTSKNVTVTLGTPSTLTGATTNAVTTNSHTHQITVTKTDVGLSNVTNDAQVKKAGDTMSGDLEINKTTPTLKLTDTNSGSIVYNNTTTSIDFVFD